MSEFSFYPDKPKLESSEKSKKNGAITLLSLLAFVFSLVFVFPDSLLSISFLVIALVFHELGHFSFMKLFKYQQVRMLFIPLMGAFVQGMKDKYSQVQSFLVVLAGPIPGMIIGILSFLLAQSWHSDWLMTLSLFFMVLNGLNLLPLDPLDGGQLLKLLVKSNQDLFQLIISFISSLLLIACGLLIEGGIMITIFGFLMAFRVRNFQRNYEIRKDLRLEAINYESTYNELNNKQYAELKEVVLRNMPALRKYKEISDDEEAEFVIASQVRNILVAPLVRDASIFQLMLVYLVWLLAFCVPIVLFYSYPLDWYINAIKNW